MKVKVRFMGVLSHFSGVNRLELDLDRGTTVNDLLAEIGARYGPRFPEEIWDRQERKFTHAVRVLGQAGRQDTARRLGDSEEVVLMVPTRQMA